MAEKQLNIRLSEEGHKAFKLACIRQGRTMQEVILDLIACWMYNEMEKQAQPDDQGEGVREENVLD